MRRCRAVARANIFRAEFEYDDDDPSGYRAGMARIGRLAGGQELAVKLFEIPPSEQLCPYHYEYVEEWLVVIDGAPTLRTKDGESQLERGDVVAFPAGPDGAHKVSNQSEKPAIVLMFSSASEPAVSVYPDSDKIGVWTPGGADNVMLKRADGSVDYYEGER
jgi:uncharacterized cupin superfamily protein